MSGENQSTRAAWWKHINEDWWAVIIAVVLILLVFSGLLRNIPW